MKRLAALAVVLFATTAQGGPLPDGFVYLREVAPTIRQDMKYYGDHNVTGRPVPGYEAPECILTRPAAEALAAVAKELNASALALKVYDCYRPQRAADVVTAWGQDLADQQTKAEFYPNLDKAEAAKLAGIAGKTGSSRGSTVAAAIVPLPTPLPQDYVDGAPRVACTAPYTQRFRDNALDYGTAFDCLDPLSRTANPDVSLVARHNRQLLQAIMAKYGFRGHAEEWWRFSFDGAALANTRLDFPITAPGAIGGP